MVAEVGLPARLLLWRCWTYRKSRKKQRAVTEAVVQQSRKVKLPSRWITCRERPQGRHQRLPHAAEFILPRRSILAEVSHVIIMTGKMALTDPKTTCSSISPVLALVTRTVVAQPLKAKRRNGGSLTDLSLDSRGFQIQSLPL